MGWLEACVADAGVLLVIVAPLYLWVLPRGGRLPPRQRTAEHGTGDLDKRTYCKRSENSPRMERTLAFHDHDRQRMTTDLPDGYYNG